MRLLIQPLLRTLLLRLANYQVTIEGELPSKPSILAGYPHGEHANSILLPQKDLVALAGADHWHLLMRLLIMPVIDSLPIVRTGVGREERATEYDNQAKVLNERQKHLLIYPQGTRRGPAENAPALRQQIKRGVGFIAFHHQVDTVPIGFVYPDDYQPQKGGIGAWQNIQARLVRKGRKVPVTVRIGEPIEPPISNSRPAIELYMNVLARELYNLVH